MGDHFCPKTLTSLLDILPSETWRKGDISGNNSKRAKKYDCWQFSTGDQNVYDINDSLKVIYEKFVDKKKMIKEFVVENKLDVSLDIKIEMNKDQTPAVYFEKEILDFLHWIEAIIDIDMYII